MTALNERDIQIALYLQFMNNSIALVPNTYQHSGESDMLRVMPSMLTAEYEIKLSRADFKADMKKPKHKRFEQGVARPTLQGLFGNYTFTAKRNVIPNRFSFVVPENLVMIEDIPPYAGLYYAIERTHNYRHSVNIKEVKKPPLIHSDKFSPGEMQRLFKSCMYKMWHEIMNNRKIP